MGLKQVPTMPTAFLTYSAFVEMFEPSGDFSGYDDDGGIDIEWKTVKCKNPAREASGLWCAFLWKPASEVYDGKWMRQEYNGSSPFAFWWSDMSDETEHEECDCCEVRFSIEDEDAYQYIKGKQPIYVCVKCYKANKEHYDEIEAEYKSDDE